MINAFKVLWKTVKDIWEDMLLLVLMHVLTLICGIPLFATLLIPPYLALAAETGASIIPAFLVALVLSIPTAIPFAGAWFALYAVCNRVANGFAISWEIYFTSFKQYIFKAWRYMAIANSIGILIVVNFFWYPQAFPDQSWVSWVMGAWLAAGLFWLAIQLYVFPFYVEQETKSWRVALRNSALIAGANPLFTLILLVVTLLLVGLCVSFLPPLFVLIGLLLWVMVGTEAVVNRITAYRARAEAEAAKAAKKNPVTKREG
ncbi:MAG: hypothetical protein M1546_13190 [Chloroflexi bacterium]|nr:hypothetical protein [Chloroflexota bacterium]